MKRHFLILAALLGITLAAPVIANAANPDGRWRSYRAAQHTPWHGSYQHTAWGSPVVLVVPPTVGIHTEWGWGVGGTQISRIHHQFNRRYPAVESSGMPFSTTPNWPSNTEQFGVYYIRGPW
ncbi:MAG: hypothetical protein KDA42_14835 [Planctomycetales bacterium]|nr:hypothetical protein [Planctomycetales bacterium]